MKKVSTSSEKRVNSYFKFMKNWDTESKKNLIIQLTKSIDEKSADALDFSACFGAWEDDRSADQIIDEIRSDRVNSKDIENF